MAIVITSPEGEEITIDGTKVCQGSSPQVCYEEHPDIIRLMIDNAWHQGWQVKQDEAS